MRRGCSRAGRRAVLRRARLDVPARPRGAARPGRCTALHVNYGLRDARPTPTRRTARALCARLGVRLRGASAPARRRGNVQAWARDVRYARGRSGSRERDALIADRPHRDRPGRDRALPARRLAGPARAARDAGALGPARAPAAGRDARARPRPTARERGLAWREDASNATSARGRIRDAPARRCASCTRRRRRTSCARWRCCATRPRCSTRPSTPRSATADARERAPRGGSRAAARAGAARGPAARRRRAAGGRPRPSSPRTPTRSSRSPREGTAALDLPGGLRAISEYGRADGSSAARAELAPAAGALADPGRVAFGGGELSCERGATSPIADGTLDADALAPTLEVRAWRPGDRMRPLGLGGTQLAAGPVHRPQGPARAASHAAGRGLRRRDRVGARRRHRRALPRRPRTPTRAGAAGLAPLDSAAP